MSAFERLEIDLIATPRRWLVTGSAGFIGSNLVEYLLQLGQYVVGVDDYSTGRRENTTELLQLPHAERYRFVEGSVEDPAICVDVCGSVDIVLHQAAIGSVPRSVHDPMRTHRANVNGFLTLLIAARDSGVRRFVFASSSSVYGDSPVLPKSESEIGRPLSPYAVSKYTTELYADVFQRCYGIQCIGLRYFNVFGRRQSTEGAYAAVIPRWVSSLINDEPCEVFGDGESTRDFCYIDNVLQANVLAATTTDPAATGRVYNIANGRQTSLNELFALLRDALVPVKPTVGLRLLEHMSPREGDIRHSLADISEAKKRLMYEPSLSAHAGISRAIDWYWQALRLPNGATTRPNRPRET